VKLYPWSTTSNLKISKNTLILQFCTDTVKDLTVDTHQKYVIKLKYFLGKWFGEGERARCSFIMNSTGSIPEILSATSKPGHRYQQ
jgi:hypothetical protein